MIRLFKHYIPYPVLLLVGAAEAGWLLHTDAEVRVILWPDGPR